MKVILNRDVNPLGEEGDVKDVANGYARNYLFPRGLAVPYNERSVLLFEERKAEIEARKEEKRKDASSLKDRLEALEITITMPAGANGKLYGAVTAQTIVEELAKNGFQIERKRIELPGNSFKAVGKYKVHIRLYESQSAEIVVVVAAQPNESQARSAAARGPRRTEAPQPAAAPEAVEETQGDDAPAEAADEAQAEADESSAETEQE